MSYSSPPPASHTVLVPGDDPTNPVPLVATSHPPQALESGSHPVASVSSSLVPPSAHASSHLTDEEAALLLRLYNLQAPAIDISHVMAAMSGHAEFTIDEVQLLWRLHNLNLTTEDTNFIVDTVRRRSQNAAVAHNNTGRPLAAASLAIPLVSTPVASSSRSLFASTSSSSHLSRSHLFSPSPSPPPSLGSPARSDALPSPSIATLPIASSGGISNHTTPSAGDTTLVSRCNQNPGTFTTSSGWSTYLSSI
jgi:hypothetical protein